MLRGLFNIIYYSFHRDRTFFFGLVRFLGFLPGRISLYRTALTHKSAVDPSTDSGELHNERLEYLGDAVLNSIVAEYLYHEYEDRDEGYLTKLRARIVKRKQLDAVAIKMGLPTMLRSNTERGTPAKHLYGNALEAIMGAVFLDRGKVKTMHFFKRRMIQRYIDLEALASKDSDYKSQIIEWSQRNRKELWFNTEEEGKTRENIPVFLSELKLGDKILAVGYGRSKKEAEQRAAKVALKGISK